MAMDILAQGDEPRPRCCCRTTAIPGIYRFGSCVRRDRSPTIPCSPPRSCTGVDVLERTTLAVHHGTLSSAGDSGAGGHRGPLGATRQGANRTRGAGSRAGRCKAISAVLRPAGPRQGDTAVPISHATVPGLEAQSPREITIPWISFKEGLAGPTKVELSLAPEIVIEQTGPGLGALPDDVRVEPVGEGRSSSSWREIGPEGSSFHIQGTGLRDGSAPSFGRSASLGQDGSGRGRRHQEHARCSGSSRTGPIFRLPFPRMLAGSGLASTAGLPGKSTTTRRSSTDCGFPASAARDRSWSSSNTSGVVRIPHRSGGLRGSLTAGSSCRPSGKCGCPGARPWSASRTVGPMRISGTGMVMCGSDDHGRTWRA